MTIKRTTAGILFALVVAPFAAQVAGKSLELNPQSFEQAIQSKNTFIKWYAPWCGHCKALAPDWDTLAEKYSASSSVMIASVDCTTDENKDLCQQYGVSGYPTLKYFKDGSSEGQDYKEGRGLEELESFVDEELNKKCIVGSEEEMNDEKSNCSDKEKEYARKVRAQSNDERKAQMERLEKMKGGSMKPELKSWIFQRLHILNSLETVGGASDEF